MVRVAIVFHRVRIRKLPSLLRLWSRTSWFHKIVHCLATGIWTFAPKAITLCRNSLKITIAPTITLLRRKCELDFSHRQKLGGIYLSSKRVESCSISTHASFLYIAILKHKQEVCARRRMMFTVFKYLSLCQRYSSFCIMQISIMMTS